MFFPVFDVFFCFLKDAKRIIIFRDEIGVLSPLRSG